MFKAFANDEQSTQIYDLTIENQTDCINIYGNLQISRDQAGLEAAKALQAILNDAVKALEETQNLPEKIQVQNIKEIENPFL